MDFGNTCALICRFILLILLLLGLILSCIIATSCHFISAVTHNNETHGVGLQSFETEDGTCVPHNNFVVKNYNGMEMAAKVGGIVAPTCAALVILWLILECCKKDGCIGGKCIPVLLLIGSVVGQSITFLLFQSDLFCSNRDITACKLGENGFQSIQACLVYGFSMVLYYCGPTPIPFTPPQPKVKAAPPPQKRESSGSGAKKKKKDRDKERDKKDVKDVKPKKDQDWTRELYEERRQTGKVKGKGKSGRKKKEILEDLNNGRSPKDKDEERYNKSYENSIVSYEPEKYKNKERERKSPNVSSRKQEPKKTTYEDSIVSYEPEKYKKKERERKSGTSSRKQEPKFDEYVDTDPDGMDWSAYTPDQRDAYYDRQRVKKQEKKEKNERERERHEREEKERERERNERDYDRDGGDGRGGRRNSREDDYTHDGYDDSYTSRGYDDSYRHNDSYYSNAESQYERSPHSSSQQYRDGGRGDGRGGYNDEYTSPGSGRNDEYTSPGSGRNDEYTSPGSRRNDEYTSPGSGRDSRDYSSRGGGGGRNNDDYSYSQDEYSYAQDYNDSYDRSSSRRGSGGRDDSRGSPMHDDSYYDESYASSYYDSRRGGGHRDDPSFV